MNVLFFDTYALFEIIKGNPRYEKFTKGIGIVTTKLNLMELYYGLLREKREQEAEKYYELLKDYCIEIEDQIVKKAMEFKLMNKKKKLSYIDCIGYIMSKTKGILFLTGDEQFRNIENVEFIK